MKRKRERLAQRRKMAGYRQERLADVLRVERSTVAHWERAETEPQPWLRPQLAKALDISRDVLAELLADVVGITRTTKTASTSCLRNPPSLTSRPPES